MAPLRSLSTIETPYTPANGMTREKYEDMYAASVADPAGFFAEQARERLEWMQPFSDDQTKVTDFGDGGAEGARSPSIAWFADGVINASANCLDRHVDAGHGDRVAFHWEPDDPKDAAREVTYDWLLEETCRVANVLAEDFGVKKGDRVSICMPMVPETVACMLACARIGAVHSVIFGGFSAQAVAGRILDCGSTCVITADEAKRAGKRIPLKATVDEALGILARGEHADQVADGSGAYGDVGNVLVLQHTGSDDVAAAFDGNGNANDVWYHDAVPAAAAARAPEPMSAEDPLFILYTSGSTGKPKGVLHTTGGYLLHTALTHDAVFDHPPQAGARGTAGYGGGVRRAGGADGGDSVFWCTADVGWITGHSYVVYGPLCNGATQVMFEGVPNWPSASRVWEICDKFGVTCCYTAPTAIRALMTEGDAPVQATRRSSLRLLGTVGEPINPEAWRWYHEVVGDARCPIVDTWWQTETGGILMSPLPGVTPMKPGSCCWPLFGVQPELVDENGAVLTEADADPATGAIEGNLCVRESWPGQMRTVFGDHQRFTDTYFAMFPGKYFTGDRAMRDADGYYWITGRADDVINVSGHRLGTAEIESALVGHEAVAEAAVVGYPHDIKGTGIYAFVTLMQGLEMDAGLQKDLVAAVRADIGPVASPDLVQWAPALPKTRSGKIMRRILRKIAEDDCGEGTLGDTTTLQDPAVVDSLIENRMNRGE